MKKSMFLFFVMVLFAVPVVWAQDLAEKDVPTTVMEAFKKKFPSTTEAKWKKNKSGKLEVDFKLAGKKAEAKFSPDGKWVSSKQRVEKGQLPAKANEYVKKSYAGYEIDKVVLQEESKDNKKEYDVELKKGNAKEELEFDGEGNFVKKKEKDKEKKAGK
jgi:hypothetical protein